MEHDPERPYSVLTRNDLKEKMKKQIENISDFFCVSKSDATILLMCLGWDSLRVSEFLGVDKEKPLTESGLKSVVNDSKLVFSDSSHEFNGYVIDSSCGICFRTCDDDDIDDDELISTSFCSHKFCSTCFRDNLVKNINSLETNQSVISCPNQDCLAAVDPDTIEKLTIRDKEIYDKYILRSYLEQNKVLMIKFCPAKDCNYAIEFHEDENDEEFSLNVVCLCGHTFCWRCKLESHKPVTCNNASDWLFRDLKNLEKSDESLNVSWIETNTKRCPNCRSSVSMGGLKHRQFLTCVCRFCFCSKCLRSKQVHKTELGFFGACVEPLKPKPEITCLDIWKASEISLEEAKTDLEVFDKYIIKKPSILKEQDIRIIREGLMLIIQCRQVLKWSCVYEYYHTEYEISKKEYLRFLQEDATNTLYSYLKTLLEETEGAFSASAFEELCNFRNTLSTATSNIGNFFHHFVKTLQDGLVDVKVKSYDNVAGSYWFCDRCTYGNTWLRKECKICYDAPEDLSYLSLY